MCWAKAWRLGVLGLVALALIALAVAPIPGLDIVVNLPPPGQTPEPGNLWRALGFAALALVALLAPPTLLIWLAARVLARGRFLS